MTTQCSKWAEMVISLSIWTVDKTIFFFLKRAEFICRRKCNKAGCLRSLKEYKKSIVPIQFKLFSENFK